MKQLSLILLIALAFSACDSNKKSNAQSASVPAVDSTLGETSKMLEEDLYWEIIAKSMEKTSSQEGQAEVLIKEIQKLTPKQMIGFQIRTEKFTCDLYNSEMWCAAYIMNGGCSDDEFDYFMTWVISRGKDVFYAAKKNPDGLIAQVKPGQEGYDFEDFWYVAADALEMTNGADLYEYMDASKYVYPDITFNWEEENPLSMKKICPKLFDALWED